MAIQNIFTGNAPNDGTGDTLREAFTKVNSNFLELDSSIDGLANVATSGNYDDLTNKPTLGTAAALDVGTSANSVVQLDIDGKLPAVDGSLLTGISAGGTPGGSDTQVQFNDGGAFGGDSGFTFNKTSKAVTLGGATVTTDAPVLDLSQTWNDAAVTFTGLKLNVTDTASAAGSRLLDLQVGGVSRFNVSKNGDMSIGSNRSLLIPSSTGGARFVTFADALEIYTAATTVSNGTRAYRFDTSLFQMRPDASIGWASTVITSSSDLILRRRAAANLQLGAADAAAPVAQTLSVQSVVAGTSNTAGANLTIAGSQGTGTGAGGSIVFQVAPAGASGTAQNSLATFAEMTSARVFNFYNTTDVTTNFERGFARWSSNVFEIGTEAAGTGTARRFRLRSFELQVTVGSIDVFLVQSAGNIIFNSNNARDIGVSGGVARTVRVGTSVENGGYDQFTEMASPPAAPSANAVRIYAEDDGAGKTRLMALFATGAAQQIAIEP
jgi:hypothetical protein